MGGSDGEITRILSELRDGHRDAEERLIPLVYAELKRIAAAHLRRERRDHTLQATALVHEAYLRLIGQTIDWQSRAHFFATAARMMRRILVDHARAQRALKREGALLRVDWNETLNYAEQRSGELVALDDALLRLASFDPRQSRIVELRFFGGMTEEEIGEVLGVSSRTVKRDWTIAKSWLYGELAGDA
jgi:RNA polymerase sigma factor (TIGR02999 family)